MWECESTILVCGGDRRHEEWAVGDVSPELRGESGPSQHQGRQLWLEAFEVENEITWVEGETRGATEGRGDSEAGWQGVKVG